MDRLISADALKNDFPKDEDWEYPVNTNEYVCERIDAQPTVDAVRHGKWKQISERYVTSALRFYVCTECGEKSVGATRYCPHCGAKMDGEE